MSGPIAFNHVKSGAWLRGVFYAKLFARAADFLMTMKQYPPSQTPGSFNLEKVQKQIEATGSGR